MISVSLPTPDPTPAPTGAPQPSAAPLPPKTDRLSQLISAAVAPDQRHVPIGPRPTKKPSGIDGIGQGHALIQLQARIYQESRAALTPLPQLMHWLLNQRNLDAAWHRVSAADGANTPGIDGQIARELKGRSAPWLARLARDASHGTYRPLPPRWLEFEKAPGSRETRRLGILALRDRVLLTAFKQVLEPILEPRFLTTSFGFRPGRSVAAALAEALHLLEPHGNRPAYPWAAQLDVADCFDTVDHQLLSQQLRELIADQQALDLLERLLTAGSTVTRHWFARRRVGLVQGSPLSPLLCNLYLHPLDQAVDALARQTQQGVRLLRYADDLLLLARDAALGRQALALIRKVLAHRRQQLKHRKTRVGPAHRGIDWLGVHIRPRTNPWTGSVRFGYVIPDDKVRDMLQRIVEMTAPPSSRIDAAAFDAARWIVSINTQLRQWYEAYQFTDNGPDVFQTIDEVAHQRVGLLLRAITGLRPSSLERLKLRLPRGFHTWHLDGVRLVVLSALAPRRPARLVRRPAWQRLQTAASRPPQQPPCQQPPPTLYPDQPPLPSANHATPTPPAPLSSEPDPNAE